MTETTVEVQISLAEHVFVKIKTRGEYKTVLEDALDITAQLREHLCDLCPERERAARQI